MHDKLKWKTCSISARFTAWKYIFGPVRFTLNTTLTQSWQRPVTCIDTDGVDRSSNARVLRRWSSYTPSLAAVLSFPSFFFFLFFLLCPLGTWVSRNVAAQVFKQLEIFLKKCLNTHLGEPLLWRGGLGGRGFVCVLRAFSLRCCCVLRTCASVCFFFAGGCRASVFQQWYTATMNLLGTWLTERMDQQLHVYQLKILIRITKVMQLRTTFRNFGWWWFWSRLNGLNYVSVFYKRHN